MESVAMTQDPKPYFWNNRSVFLTGHTGFKGGWASLWLTNMGAEVYGYSLAPPTSPNLFTELELETCLAGSTIADIRDRNILTDALNSAKPSIVINMAAQALVRAAYMTPAETFETNVMGTVNLLEAARQCKSVEAIVNITTDKVYENIDSIWPYRECDPLGGRDPYSASKACAEFVTAAYRSSFLRSKGPWLATARAGNVIGGGDWAADRLIPDFVRSIDRGETTYIRSPHAVRPWQHVLEPLCGYFTLAERLAEEGEAFASAWNFGPEEDDARKVSWVMERLCERFPEAKWEQDATPQFHEATVLKLDSTKSKTQLHWKPRWNLGIALDATMDWYQALKNGENMLSFSIRQIERYLAS